MMTFVRGNLSYLRTIVAIGLACATLSDVAAQQNNRVLASFNRTEAESTAAARRQVQPVGLETPSQRPVTTEDRRLLAPPTRRSTSELPSDQTLGATKAPNFALPKIESFATAGSGLAIVVGLFLVCMWLLRRSGPKPTSPLPAEAVSVLGRVPLAARNFAHLIQVGNKLVLVAITPDGVSPITEVVDPHEVQRLLGLCVQTRSRSSSAEFHDVLKHLAQEPASGFLGKDVAGSYTAPS
ncbi:MAG: flagellar biosynthetic protein FliO [Planctomycetota bacterium]